MPFASAEVVRWQQECMGRNIGCHQDLRYEDRVLSRQTTKGRSDAEQIGQAARLAGEGTVSAPQREERPAGLGVHGKHGVGAGELLRSEAELIGWGCRDPYGVDLRRCGLRASGNRRDWW